MVQKLNDNSVPSTHIIRLLGHKNIQSINNYSHVNNSSGSASSTKPAVLECTSQNKRVLAQGEYFNINIDTVNKSPKTVSTTKQHSF